MQLFAISKKKRQRIFACAISQKKSHIILLEVGRPVMKENDDEMIFIKGRFCHIKHIFAKGSVGLYLFVYMIYLWVTLLRARTFILVEKRLCSYKAFMKPEMIGDLELPRRLSWNFESDWMPHNSFLKKLWCGEDDHSKRQWQLNSPARHSNTKLNRNIIAFCWSYSCRHFVSSSLSSLSNVT